MYARSLINKLRSCRITPRIQFFHWPFTIGKKGTDPTGTISKKENNSVTTSGDPTKGKDVTTIGPSVHLKVGTVFVDLTQLSTVIKNEINDIIKSKDAAIGDITKSKDMVIGDITKSKNAAIDIIKKNSAMIQEMDELFKDMVKEKDNWIKEKEAYIKEKDNCIKEKENHIKILDNLDKEWDAIRNLKRRAHLMEISRNQIQQLKFVDAYNLKGALEFIKRLHRYDYWDMPPYSKSLNKIMEDIIQEREFSKILTQSCLDNQQDLQTVNLAFGGLYNRALVGHFDRLHEIVLEESYWSPSELLALGILFRYFGMPFEYCNKLGVKEEYPFELKFDARSLLL